MPGLTPFDVENLNRSIAGFGNTFAQRREEERRQQALDIEQDLRQKTLDAEMRRLSVEEGRQNLLGQGTTDAWLTDEDGGSYHFQGPQTGLDQLMIGRQKAGKPMSVLEQPPTAKPQYGSFTMYTPFGQVTRFLNSEDDLNETMENAKKIGGKAPPGVGQPREITLDQQASTLEDAATQHRQKAGELRSSQGQGPGEWDPTIEAQAAREDQSAQQMEDRAKAFRTAIARPANDPTAFQTVTTTTPQDPLNPTAPRTSVTRKVPVQQQQGRAAASANLGAELNNARAAIQMNPGNSAAIKQRYKQRTGLDFPG